MTAGHSSCDASCAATNDNITAPEAAALRNFNPANVSNGSTADFKQSLKPVRFTPSKPTSRVRYNMSASCQKRTNAPQQFASLFDHLVGAHEQRRRIKQPLVMIRSTPECGPDDSQRL